MSSQYVLETAVVTGEELPAKIQSGDANTSNGIRYKYGRKGMEVLLPSLILPDSSLHFSCISTATGCSGGKSYLFGAEPTIYGSYRRANLQKLHFKYSGTSVHERPCSRTNFSVLITFGSINLRLTQHITLWNTLYCDC
jgi:hypothetical protein